MEYCDSVMNKNKCFNSGNLVRHNRTSRSADCESVTNWPIDYLIYCFTNNLRELIHWFSDHMNQVVETCYRLLFSFRMYTFLLGPPQPVVGYKAAAVVGIGKLADTIPND